MIAKKERSTCELNCLNIFSFVTIQTDDTNKIILNKSKDDNVIYLFVPGKHRAI